jgi:glycosyltransferase involved in cell wall biosynthesis
MTPLVTVICISYNHERFVREALDSVARQTYSPVELILVDDASTDNSVEEVRAWLASHPQVQFIALRENGGNCKAFNTALPLASGKYVIDLSADDLLMPNRIERGVAFLESHPEVGVQFTDAERIDVQGRHLGYHSDRFPHATIPQGRIFREVLSRYFINSPTCMIRKSLLDELGGFDESLAYEDFDFWVRSTPRTSYAYLPEALVRRREIPGSMGNQQYTRGSRQAWSTLAVCKKAVGLCVEPADFHALRRRIMFEFRQALWHGNLSLGWAWVRLWMEIR